MKQFFISAALLLAATFAFTSCDNNKDQGPTFSSDMIGKYAVDFVAPEDEESLPQYKVAITPTWRDPENIPTTEMFGMEMKMDLVILMMQSMAAVYSGMGLDAFEFKNDGTFSVKYHPAILEPGLDGILNPVFSTDVVEFPNAQTQALIPAGAITYYTAGGKLYFAVSRAYLKQIGEAELEMDLDETVGQLLEANPALKQSIVVSPTHYALPLSYKFNADKTVTISVDRAMMAPFLPVIEQFLPMIPEEIDLDGTIIVARKLATDVVNAIKSEMTDLVIAITLKSK